MTQRLLERYRKLVAEGHVVPDMAQELAAEKLQLLSNRLAAYAPPAKLDFFSFFTRKRGEVPKGLYIYGEVGRGKTMLMDLFYQTAPLEQKLRMHFHEFMAMVHSRLGEAREVAKEDPVLAVAAMIARENRLLCLDELVIIDIADATIVSRLFGGLLRAGTVIVTTSNVHPRELYKDGRNRDLFLPFIDLVEENMEIFQLEARQDYRLVHLANEQLYFWPNGPEATARMDRLWRELTFCEEETPVELKVLGRVIRVPRACLGAARFGFGDLCAQPLGARDYLAIAREFHLVFVDNIPIMTASLRNETRRFITLIDTFYDHNTGLIASADAEPDGLCKGGDTTGHFARTASRLNEMRTTAYLTKTLANNATALAALTATPVQTGLPTPTPS